MPRRLAVLLAALAALALSLPAAAPAASCANVNLLPSSGNLAKIRTATLCLLNKERTKRGLVALKRDARLENAASRYARYMVSKRFLAHVSPGGSTPEQRIRRSGYFDDATRGTFAENLAAGTGRLPTPARTVDGWMRSPRHRRNILGAFHDIGVGVDPRAPWAGRRGATYVTNFGAKG